MKKVNRIFYVLLIFALFAIGYYKFVTKDDVNKEENTINLNVITYSDEEIIATQENTNIKYKISNSQINITDYKDNPVSWNELKDAKVVKVYYSGKIKEISPAIFDKITKIVIIS